MNAMTLEQVRDWHRHQLNFLPESGVPTDLHQNAADAIDAHLAQTAKAVDVGDSGLEGIAVAIESVARWILDLFRTERRKEAALVEAVVLVGAANMLRAKAGNTRALSGEKAGPVDGWKLVPVEPTPAMRAAFRADPEALTHFTHTTLQCADFDSRYRAMLGAASTATHKESQP